MKEKKYVIIFVVIILILMIFMFNQQREKQMYKKYISNQLASNIQTLILTIDENQRTYTEVISNNLITPQQSKTLMHNNEIIRDIINKTRELAIATKKRKDGYQYNESSANAGMLTRLYYIWHEEVFKTDTKLDEEMKNQIEKSSELNEVWIKVTHKDTSKNYKLNQSAWLILLDELETKTVEFLHNNDMNGIEEIWKTRPEKKDQ
ncbi:hypothetical protein ACFSTH_02395 [Paenibacillus yanchengensis]|uniref:Uncharacterized protein n=1 Tax=Paenibacillus yanchengensis TaxID=2035833 RepID=A0ABW4YGJ9_9BACL